jgi:hypothetical protein
VSASAALESLFATGALLLAGRGGFFFRFVIAGAAFVSVAALLRSVSPGARAWGQVVASLALLAVLTSPPIVLAMALYALLLFWLIEHAPLGRARAVVVVPVLALQVLLPILFPASAGKNREVVAFASNVTLLRAWGYAYDRLWRPLPERPGLRDFALFMFFFPAFPNGPLVSLEDFRRRCLPGYWGVERAAVDWGGLARVGVGLAAAAPALLLAPVLAADSYAAAAQGGPVRAWAQAAGAYLAVYLGFTAWTEAAIGLGRLSGVALPENFAAPHAAYGVADFWRRWNISLGHWLRVYVYLPLGGALPRRPSGVRSPEWRNTAAVFGVMAAYHVAGSVKLLGLGFFPPTAWLPWLLWAALNTVGVLATRGLTSPASPVRRAPVVLLTCAFSAVTVMTAFFPAGMSLAQLAAIYRRLLPV